MSDLSRDDVVRAIRGQCASPGTHLGHARIVRDARGLFAVERGEVVILEGATAAAGIVLDLAGAVVAERGGVLSNLGTLARERHVPCVVGAAGATTSVADGDLVLVDADASVVFVLAEVVAVPV